MTHRRSYYKEEKARRAALGHKWDGPKNPARYNRIKAEMERNSYWNYMKRVYNRLGGAKSLVKHFVPRKYHMPLAIGNAMYGAYYDAPRYAMQWADQAAAIKAGANVGPPSTALVPPGYFGESPPPPTKKMVYGSKQYSGGWYKNNRQVKLRNWYKKSSFGKRRRNGKKISRR